MITLRLDPDLEKEISTVAKNLGLTKSDLIRKSVIEYLGKIESPNAWELGKEYFGKYSSGLKNLSEDRKMILKEKIRAKRK
ncbi:ribbon-helix-helix CopG family protein [Desulfobotulus alkaliphilus]|uniref:Ribbon-helix-helix CopG family protein n=1 Tax=Desulfobotulus alkaliphilus TaxID=622671 RepID=A0A562R6E5_9BACT|nr:ribbon-helix-helix protein, CopG family [Desulfobotulus alkaliphilus]TWI64615.1 ribbon-helix-helix CopG family protein [Desulfobotulus alkaliphilus]